MKTKAVSAFLWLAAVGLGGWAAWERLERNRLQEQVAGVIQERDVLRVTAGKKLALQSKTEVKSDGPQGLGPESEKALADEAGEGKPPGGKPEASGKNTMAEMMKNPAMKDMMKSQMRAQMDLLYRDLFDLLGLDSGKQDKLSKLLAERSGAGMEFGLAMMSGQKMSKEEKQKQADGVKAAMEASDKAIRELLGADAYGQFDRFEKSQPERQQLQALAGQLKDKGIALTEDAESKLMDVMYQERTQFKFDVDLGDQRDTDLSKLTPGNMEKYFAQQEVLQEKIATRAGPILTPEQLAVFRANQKQQTAMARMGMEMGLKMMDHGNTK